VDGRAGRPPRRCSRSSAASRAPRRTFAVTVRGKESGVAHIAVGKLPWGVTIR
jgi:hypothetical protein